MNDLRQREAELRKAKHQSTPTAQEHGPFITEKLPRLKQCHAPADALLPRTGNLVHDHTWLAPHVGTQKRNVSISTRRPAKTGILLITSSFCCVRLSPPRQLCAEDQKGQGLRGLRPRPGNSTHSNPGVGLGMRLERALG